MKLDYFAIKGFRRINEARIECGDATFLIGENNVGKSTTLKAMEIFFSETSKLSDEDYYKIGDNTIADEVILEAKFSNLPTEAQNWRGFKGRIINENIGGELTSCIYYRKTFQKNSTVKREMKALVKSLKDEFRDCRSIQDYISKGVKEDAMLEAFGAEADRTKPIAAKEKDKLELVSEIWNYEDSNTSWEVNPGGIEGNISIRLPKFLLIPAESKKDDIDGTNSVLQKTMKELFEEVRDISDNYKKAQEYLDLLAKELDPNDANKEFGKMLLEINDVVSGVFSDTKIHIEANLSDPGSVIKPSFNIEMSSNVKTKPERQGMGSVRSVAFALLRYREKFLERKRMNDADIRPLIIGFEEPEMYLHPNAANLMRDKIYELATSTYSKIICTTHSPFMIDLSKKIDQADYPKQVLNLFKLEFDPTHEIDCCNCMAFNTTDAFKNLQSEDKQYIKFLLRMDDSVSRVFFCKKVIIVEGDTEELLLKETVARLTIDARKKFLYNYQVVKARGKASIISMVKYFKALSINPFVIHDEDTEDGAIKFNGPILQALDYDEGKRLMVKHTIEDLLGYPEPHAEKPFQAYRHIKNNWNDEWNSVAEEWRISFEKQVAPDIFISSTTVKNDRSLGVLVATVLSPNS